MSRGGTSTRYARACRSLMSAVLAGTALAAVAHRPAPATRPAPAVRACTARGGPVDFDGDGRADVVGIDAQHNLRLYAGDPSHPGSLDTGSGSLMWPAGGLWANFKGIAAGDFNNDGIADIAGIDANNDLRLYLGSGGGRLNTASGALMYQAGGWWNGFRALVAGDFNNDGNTDIAAVDVDNNLRLYLGDGTGRLAAGGGTVMLGPTVLPPATGPWAAVKYLVAGDFDGDGNLDIAGIDANNDVRLYRGNGDGTLDAASGWAMWPTGGLWKNFGGLAIGDFGGNGFVDIAGIDASGDLRLYQGDGTGHVATSSGSAMWPTGGLWKGFSFITGLPSARCTTGRTAIVAMGDSITAGFRSSSGDGYRGYLGDLIGTSTMGTAWLFEGAQETGSRFWSHEGHSGCTIGDITTLVQPNLGHEGNAGLRPDIVLLDAGTNDAYKDQYPASRMLSDLNTLLDQVLAASPTVRVVLAQIAITTVASAGQQQVEQDFDAALPGIAAQRGPRVTIVDMRGVHLSSDGIHPDDAGYQDMAHRWYAALSAAGWLPGQTPMPSPTPGPTTVGPTPSGTGSVPAPPSVSHSVAPVSAPLVPAASASLTVGCTP